MSDFVRQSVELIIKRRSKLGEVELDACVREQHGANATVTDHPVEAEPGQSSSISDNIRLEPLSLRISGIVTNTPATVIGSIFGAQARIASGGSFNLAEDAHGQLLDYLLRAEEITVVTSLRTYYNMAFTEISVNRDKDSGNALTFDAVLKQITKVALKEDKIKTKLPEKSTKAKGKKPAKTADKPKEEKTSAIWKMIHK